LLLLLSTQVVVVGETFVYYRVFTHKHSRVIAKPHYPDMVTRFTVSGNNGGRAVTVLTVKIRKSKRSTCISV